MKFNLKEMILYFFIPMWLLAEIFISTWMFKAKPKKDATDQYEKKVIFLSQLPFGKGWRNNVRREDVRLFERYQFRIKIWYLSLMVPFFLIMFIFTL